MRTLAIVCFCLCLIAAIAPASADLLIPSSYAWGLGTTQDGSYAVGNAFDGNTATYAAATAYDKGSIQMNYPAGTNITGCRIYTQGWNNYWSLTSGPNRTGFQFYDWGSIPPGSWSNKTFTVGNVTTFPVYINADRGGWPLHLAEIECYGTFSPIALSADFNATPTSGQAPLYVAFQDNSTGGSGTRSYNWSVSPTTGVIGAESTSEYPTIVFTQNGNYTVTHCVDDGYTSDCETKSDYIWVYNDTSMTTTTFWVVDVFGHTVYDSSVFINDVENASWQNTTSPSSGVVEIVSLIGHTLNGYAEAIGYNDGEALGIIADGINGGVILMTSTNITNVSAGYVTLYVYVEEPTSHTPIPGAYVNLAYAEGGSTRNDGSTTSTEGFCSFVVPNNTLIYIYGEKAGYIPTSSTKESGTGSGGDASVSAILYMTNQYVTPTVTATTGPGGTIPVTVDPRTPQEKESDIALILIDYGDMLVMFFIALTIIGGVKMIMK